MKQKLNLVNLFEMSWKIEQKCNKSEYEFESFEPHLTFNYGVIICRL